MRFTELEPRFLPEGTPIEACKAVVFLCPKCFHDGGCKVEGVHNIRAVNHGHHEAGRPSWRFRGHSAENFTLDWAPGSGGASSIQIIGGCEAHFNIWNGEVVPANAPGGKGLSW